MCVYAEPGVGKTRLVGTSPGRLLILRPPVDHLDSLLLPDKTRAEQWVIRDWDDMNTAEEYLRADGGKDYDWVWVDSWSLLQDVLIDDIWETAKADKPARAKYWLDKGEYGINMGRIGSWMRHVIGPDTFNFGWTGHPAALASPDLDEDGDPVEKLMPWVQGKNMSPKCCGYMNLVAFMEVTGKNRRRVLRTQADTRFYAKDQFDAFGESGVVWDPTMPKIVKLIEASPGRRTGKVQEPGRKSAAGTTSTKRRVVRRGT